MVALSTTGPSTLLLHHHLQRNTTPPLPPKCPYSPTSTISPTLTITSAPLDLYSTSGSSFYPPSCPSTGHNSANSSVLNRLGEEITTFMSSLVGSRGSRISSTSDSPLLLTPTQPSLYAHFRPQSRNVQRNPARPSRYGVPDVNMGREQELGDSAGRQGMVRCLFEGSTSPREISVAPERGVGVGGRNSRREI